MKNMKKLSLNKEVVKRLTVKTNVKAGATFTTSRACSDYTC